MRAHLCAVVSALIAASACGKQPPPQTAEAEPLVQLLELPISLRHGGQVGADAAKIEIGGTELRLDGRAVMSLNEGSVPAAERSADELPRLRDALKAGPARRLAAIRMHGATPWSTTVLVLASVKAAGLSEVAFEVRKGRSTQTGWLHLSRFRVEPASDAFPRFEGAAARLWDEMLTAWPEAHAACRRSHFVDCSPAPTATRRGGGLALTLFARGQAIKTEFWRIAPADEPAEPPAPRMIEGVRAPPPEQLEPEPVTQGAFTWRFEAAIEEGLSPVSGAWRPLCGARPCGALVTADAGTMSSRILSLVGAAFPEGAAEPELVF
ncbi:MAG: hypothetical protein RMK74_03295, partial [Myxococcales bacterium]|nr:hypothetical protein [Myxococcales bacterium]